MVFVCFIFCCMCLLVDCLFMSLFQDPDSQMEEHMDASFGLYFQDFQELAKTCVYRMQYVQCKVYRIRNPMVFM